MDNWTREHDRFIAEKAEGWTLKEVAPGYFLRTAPEIPGISDGVPKYDTDVASIIRAVEDWRMIDKALDMWQVVVVDRHFRAAIRSASGHTSIADGPTIAAALAWAMYRALGGPE